MPSKARPSSRLLTVVAQVLTSALSVIAAFLLRFDFAIPHDEVSHVQLAVFTATLLKTVTFQTTGFRRDGWGFAELGDVYRLGIVNLIASILFSITTRLLAGPTFPRSVYVLDLLLSFLITCQMRFARRISRDLRTRFRYNGDAKGILIYGAGAAGVTLAREIRSNPSLKLRVVGFLDDDTQKRGHSIMSIPILGGGREAREIVAHLEQKKKKVDEVIIAIPSAKSKEMREAVANCRSTGLKCKTVPGLSDILLDKILSKQIREISIADLLGRETVQLDEAAVRKHVSGSNVLITGGAGSIGSELCRQIAGLGAQKLIAFDRAESDLFRLELELTRLSSPTEVVVEIGDIRDYQRIEEVIAQHDIQLIFHAAAYKHVPMMEAHLFEAVTNNVLGTWNVVRAARRHSVSGFVMISSDKAVNPTSIMGATKRISELIVSALGDDGSGIANYVSVRFGNVLGSNGSVIPVFQSQIEKGGPLTITHPEMRRYFMTTREAVQLVLQASTMGHSSEVFVLDMGEAVRIVDLARNMIRLAGLQPDEDIDIRFVGTRPGEKLSEELLMDSDKVVPTCHKKIKVFKSAKPHREFIQDWLAGMECLIAERNAAELIAHIRQLVPEYVSAHASGGRGPHEVVEAVAASAGELN